MENMVIDRNNIRMNEVKRLYRHGCRFAITEFLINKQNNFLVEHVSEDDVVTVGVYFNMRGAYRGIEKYNSENTLSAIRHMIYSQKED